MPLLLMVLPSTAITHQGLRGFVFGLPKTHPTILLNASHLQCPRKIGGIGWNRTNKSATDQDGVEPNRQSPYYTISVYYPIFRTDGLNFTHRHFSSFRAVKYKRKEDQMKKLICG